MQHLLCADRVASRQAGTHFLLLLPSSGHTYFVTLRFSLQEIVTKDEDKKKKKKRNNHMPRAADLCFLYLHVSQNTALYRNAEKRTQQTGSRTESVTFDQLRKLEVGKCSRGSGSLSPSDSRWRGRTGSEAAPPPSTTSEAHNMWPLSQHGWDWLLFTEECLYSATRQVRKCLSDVKPS